jgi:hypothetical protein
MRMRDFGRRGADAWVEAGGARAGSRWIRGAFHGGQWGGWLGHGGSAGVDGGEPRQNRAPPVYCGRLQ